MLTTPLWSMKNPLEFSNHLDQFETKMVLGENTYESEIELGRTMEAQTLALPNHQTTPELITTVLKALSLQYRITAEFGGLNKEKIDGKMKLELGEAVTKWKGRIKEYTDKKLTFYDCVKINKLSRYENFVSILLKNEKVKDEIFKLVFRDHFPIKPLIHYYKTCSVDLKNALLTRRVGFFRKNGFSILNLQQCENGTKDLRFFVNKKFISILSDDTPIKMNDGLTYSWKQIKNMGEMGKTVPAIIEVFQRCGLILFKPQGLKYPLDGKVTAVNTKVEKYWEQEDMPTFLTISLERLQEMLNIQITDEKPCVATVEGSCLDLLHVDNAHGASTIYLPNKDGNSYRVFPFGKYAKDFPQSKLAKLWFLGDSVEAELTYPDPSFSHPRLHGVVPHLLTLEEAEKLLTIYGKEIWHFQFAGNNCSAEFQNIFERTFGKVENGGMAANYFRYPLLKSQTPFPLNYVWGTIAKMPDRIAPFFVSCVHIMCGSFRTYSKKEEDGSTKTVSLYHSEFAETHELYLPGRLVQQILAKQIPGVTWYSYD